MEHIKDKLTQTIIRKWKDLIMEEIKEKKKEMKIR